MEETVALVVAALMIVGGVLYLVARVVMLMLQRRRPPRPESVEKAGSVMDAMMKLLEQQRSLSHEITGSLEKRMQELKRLIEQADETITRLASRAAAFNVTEPGSETESDEEMESPLETGTSRAERTALFGSVTAVSATNSPLPGSSISADQKQRSIYQYADQGMNIHEIAREMQIGKGEVKLILSLRQGE